MYLDDEEIAVTQADAESAENRLSLISFFTRHAAERIDEMAESVNNKGGAVSVKDIQNAKGFMADVIGDLFHEEKARCEEIKAKFYGAIESRHERLERAIVREL